VKKLRRVPILLAALLVSACGSNLPKTVRVSGRVTFDGKAPPAAGTVYFLPVEASEGFPSRPATGEFDASGQYKATTFEPGDGLMPGKYIMHIECWQSPPNLEGAPVKSFVPAKYQAANTSGFKADISPKARTQTVDVDVITR
jgi:hypothetical protein